MDKRGTTVLLLWIITLVNSSSESVVPKSDEYKVKCQNQISRSVMISTWQEPSVRRDSPQVAHFGVSCFMASSLYNYKLPLPVLDIEYPHVRTLVFYINKRVL